MIDRNFWLLDINTLLRFSLRNDPLQSVINAALEKLERNGPAFSTAVTYTIVEAIEDRLQVLPASNEVYAKWRKLLLKHEVKGLQVHDARIAATM